MSLNQFKINKTTSVLNSFLVLQKEFFYVFILTYHKNCDPLLRYS